MATLTDKALIQQVVVTKIKDLVVTLLNLEKRLFGATYRERVIEYKAKGVQIPEIKNKLRFMLTGLHFDEINSEHLLLLDLGFRLFEFMCELYDDDDDNDDNDDDDEDDVVRLDDCASCQDATRRGPPA